MASKMKMTVYRTWSCVNQVRSKTL